MADDGGRQQPAAQLTAAISGSATVAAFIDGGGITVISLPSLALKARMPDVPVPVRCMALDDEGRRLALLAGNSNKVEIRDTSTGETKHVVELPPGAGPVVAFAPGGDSLTTATSGGPPVEVRYDPAGRTEAYTGPGGHTVAIAHDRRFGERHQLVTVDTHGATRIWDRYERTLVAEAFTMTSSPVAVAFSPDGDELVVAGRGGLMSRWTVGDGHSLEHWAENAREIAAVTVVDGRAFTVGLDSRGYARVFVHEFVDPHSTRLFRALSRSDATDQKGVRSLMGSPGAGGPRRMFENTRRAFAALLSISETGKAIAAEREAMVESLTAIDVPTRKRITPQIVEAAQQIFRSQPYRTLFKRLRADPQAALAVNAVIACGAALAVVVAIGLVSLVVAQSARLHGIVSAQPDPRQFIRIAGGTLAGLLMAGWAGRLLPGLRTVRNAVQAAGLAALLLVHRRTFDLRAPRLADKLLRRYTPLKPPASWHLYIAHQTWLAVTIATAAGTVLTALSWILRWWTGRTAKRRQAVHGALLHALLDLAYHLQLQSADLRSRSSLHTRRRVLEMIEVSARLAENEWLRAMRTHDRKANRVIARQSKAIAFAIRRWTPRAALGGADVPELCNAFSMAVVNAADDDWRALGVDPAELPRGRWQRAATIAVKVLALTVPAGAAVMLLVFVHPLTGALLALEGPLLWMPVATVMRWLHVTEDFDTGQKLSELLTKPATAPSDAAKP